MKNNETQHETKVSQEGKASTEQHARETVRAVVADLEAREKAAKKEGRKGFNILRLINLQVG